MDMQGFALFRLPYAQEMTYIAGGVTQLSSCTALSDKQGFVFAPFAPSDSLPIQLIVPEEVEAFSSFSSFSSLSRISRISSFSSSSKENYHIDFHNFHAHLTNGDFQKLVLSRSIEIEKSEEVSPLDLFRRACERYPRVLVSLAYTPQSGLWLTATPEILLSGTNHEWHM